jgi:hypothetical protein
MKELYYLVHWPESQELIEIEGFEEHSSLVIDEGASYFVEKDWYDDMFINKQKNFLVDEFCSLPIDKMTEVVGEMLNNLNGEQVARVIEDAFDNLHEQAQEHVIDYVNG